MSVWIFMAKNLSSVGQNQNYFTVKLKRSDTENDIDYEFGLSSI